jgi:hypothetical protein
MSLSACRRNLGESRFVAAGGWSEGYRRVQGHTKSLLLSRIRLRAIGEAAKVSRRHVWSLSLCMWDCGPPWDWGWFEDT